MYFKVLHWFQLFDCCCSSHQIMTSPGKKTSKTLKQMHIKVIKGSWAFFLYHGLNQIPNLQINCFSDNVTQATFTLKKICSWIHFGYFAWNIYKHTISTNIYFRSDLKVCSIYTTTFFPLCQHCCFKDLTKCYRNVSTRITKISSTWNVIKNSGKACSRMCSELELRVRNSWITNQFLDSKDKRLVKLPFSTYHFFWNMATLK